MAYPVSCIGRLGRLREMEEGWQRVVEGLGMVRGSWGRFTDHIWKKACQMDMGRSRGATAPKNLGRIFCTDSQYFRYQKTNNLLTETRNVHKMVKKVIESYLDCPINCIVINWRVQFHWLQFILQLNLYFVVFYY